jgi:hypothetical protein
MMQLINSEISVEKYPRGGIDGKHDSKDKSIFKTLTYFFRLHCQLNLWHYIFPNTAFL